jgi:AcrR family transcriptional regulator
VTTPTSDPAEDASRPRRRDAERNRRRIIDAAREVLAERGLALTLNEVARHAGLGVGTVYRHFPDKDHLIDAALADQLEALVGMIEQSLSLDSAWEGLVRVMTDGMRGHVANRGLRDVALQIGTGHHQAEVVGRMVPLMEQLVARAHAEGSLRPEITVNDLTMINFMVTELADHSADIRTEVYQRYLTLLMESIRARPDPEKLAAGLSDQETRAIAEGWIESHRNRRRSSHPPKPTV